MKTTVPKKDDIQRKWYIVDAKDRTLGHISTKIANILRGKDKVIFTPHLDCGDFVIILNCDKINLTGNKMDRKTYYSHSGYPGALKETKAKDLLIKHPKKMVEHAIRGMLPKNRLRAEFMKKLKVYQGSEHPHEAQNPETLEI